MPVPVPKYTRPPAHPVIKPHRHSDPPHPTSVFGSSLPSNLNGIDHSNLWRTSKPHRIWEDDSIESLGFYEGLTTAANARVIKGDRAQACLPPVSSIPRHSSTHNNIHRHSTGDMVYDTPLSYPEDTNADLMQISPAEDFSLCPRDYEVFSPVLEDPSPETHVEDDPGSSPIGPLTPFGDYIDRAIAKSLEPSHNMEPADLMCNPGQVHDPYHDLLYGFPPSQMQNYAPPNVPQKQPSALDTAAASSASVDYKKLAEPLSEWLASYIWRVCTTGAGLPHFFRSSSYPHRHMRAPPACLAGSIRSLLLSTLLQPSAVFLSLWYITRLPVFLGPVAFGVDCVHETRFRLELLGENEQLAETHAPFRVFLLGCMLANKWLDDHTFSNKTWHTISNVAVRSLNRLEFLALAIFRHDIAISPHQWSQWLSQLLSYHTSLSSSACPQPISRPSTNPHVIIKKSLEELLQAAVSITRNCDNAHVKGLPEPVFLGLEERRREKLERDTAAAEGNIDVLDIDLDEDGPLREEYLPKRRVSRSDLDRVREDHASKRIAYPHQSTGPKPLNATRCLPPPAKWSPSGDEPILRGRDRASGQYVAPQAAPLCPLTMTANSFPDHGYQWPMLSIKHDMPMGYMYDSCRLGPARFPYDYGYSLDLPHTRSQSLQYQENLHPRLHSRSHSQMPIGYSYGNLSTQENKVEPRPFAPEQYGYYGHPFVEDSTLNYSRFPLKV